MERQLKGQCVESQLDARANHIADSEAHELSASRLIDLRTQAERDEAQQELHQILLGALADKQSENFQGEVTVMKFIGG